MYKVQILADRNDRRKMSFDGIYIEPEQPPDIPEMKRRCVEYMRRRLAASDSEFRGCRIELKLFRKIRTDFVYNDREP